MDDPKNTITFTEWWKPAPFVLLISDGALRIEFRSRPNIFHRFWHRVLLGWVWESNA